MRSKAKEDKEGRLLLTFTGAGCIDKGKARMPWGWVAVRFNCFGVLGHGDGTCGRIHHNVIHLGKHTLHSHVAPWRVCKMCRNVLMQATTSRFSRLCIVKAKRRSSYFKNAGARFARTRSGTCTPSRVSMGSCSPMRNAVGISSGKIP